MKLEDIKEIRQTTEVHEVNQSIKQGFIIVKILSSRTGEIVLPMYVLGKLG